MDSNITPNVLSIIIIPESPIFLNIKSHARKTNQIIIEFNIIAIKIVTLSYSDFKLIKVDNVPGPEIRGKANGKKLDDFSLVLFVSY